MVAQVLIHLDGDAAVLVGLGGGGQILVVLCTVVFLIEAQGQVGQLLVAVKLECVGPLLRDVGEVLCGAVRPIQGDRVPIAAHGAGTGVVRRAHGKDGLCSEDVLPEAAGGCADADEDELEPELPQAASSIIREAARQAMPAMCRFFSMRITTPFHDALL